MFLCLGMLFQSCISNKAFQTARVTPEGEKGWGMGLALPKGDFYDTNAEGEIVDTVSLGGFAAEFFFRTGITEKIDVGVNLTLLGTSGADIKYQFLGDESSTIAGSIGAGFGYLSFSADGDSAESNTIIDINIPAYFSYHPNNSIGVYLSPKYIFRKAGENSSNFGAVAGLRVGGESNGLFIEYGYLKSSDDFYTNQTQFNIGFGIGIR